LPRGVFPLSLRISEEMAMVLLKKPHENACKLKKPVVITIYPGFLACGISASTLAPGLRRWTTLLSHFLS
jgi:hypothetical protein